MASQESKPPRLAPLDFKSNRVPSHIGNTPPPHDAAERSELSQRPVENATPLPQRSTSSDRGTDHNHRWRIDEPNGTHSEGVCRHCGVTKQFRNWLAETDYITNAEHRIENV